MEGTVSRMKCSETFSLLSTAGLTALAILMAVPDASAQGTPPPPLNFQLPQSFQIPPADQRCILPGERLNLQCIIANDPDAKRVRAEEAALEAQALVAAKSGKLDPYHQVETLGKLEIFDPNLSVNRNILPRRFCALEASNDSANFGNEFLLPGPALLQKALCFPGQKNKLIRAEIFRRHDKNGEFL